MRIKVEIKIKTKIKKKMETKPRPKYKKVINKVKKLFLLVEVFWVFLVGYLKVEKVC